MQKNDRDDGASVHVKAEGGNLIFEQEGKNGNKIQERLCRSNVYEWINR